MECLPQVSDLAFCRQPFDSNAFAVALFSPTYRWSDSSSPSTKTFHSHPMGVALSQAGDAMEQAVKKLYVGQRAGIAFFSGVQKALFELVSPERAGRFKLPLAFHAGEHRLLA